MKKILFLFFVIPVFGFGQSDTISIDSVSLIQYAGGFQPKKTLGYAKSEPKPKKRFRLKWKHQEVIMKEIKEDVVNDSIKEIAQRYPNYDANRDMPLPVSTLMILDKNGKFHPSAKWETYQTFVADSVTNLLNILNCTIEPWTYQTQISVNENGTSDTTIVSHRRVKKPGGMCFYPGLGILVWSKGEIVTFYSVCFACGRVSEGSSEGKWYDYKDCIFINVLKEEVEQFGY